MLNWKISVKDVNRKSLFVLLGQVMFGSWNAWCRKEIDGVNDIKTQSESIRFSIFLKSLNY